VCGLNEAMGLVGVCFVFTTGFCYRFNAPAGHSFYSTLFARRRMPVLALHTGSLAVQTATLICFYSPADRQTSNCNFLRTNKKSS